MYLSIIFYYYLNVYISWKIHHFVFLTKKVQHLMVTYYIAFHYTIQANGHLVKIFFISVSKKRIMLPCVSHSIILSGTVPCLCVDMQRTNNHFDETEITFQFKKCTR